MKCVLPAIGAVLLFSCSSEDNRETATLGDSQISAICSADAVIHDEISGFENGESCLFALDDANQNTVPDCSINAVDHGDGWLSLIHI